MNQTRRRDDDDFYWDEHVGISEYQPVGTGTTLCLDGFGVANGRTVEFIVTGEPPEVQDDEKAGDLLIDTSRQTIVAPRPGVQGPVFVKNK
jgi:hypothetical protein